MTNKSFAIRVSATNSPEKLEAFHNIVKNASLKLESFNVEGMNKKSQGPAFTEVPLVSLPVPGGRIEAGVKMPVDRNLIGVGITDSYDVSFEAESAVKIYGICIVPIYDMDKDFDLIINAFTNYILDKYNVALAMMAVVVAPKKVKPAITEVVYHSNFVRVGNSSISYSDVDAIKKALSPKKKTKGTKLVFLG